MTTDLERIREEAAELGYKLVKNTPPIKLSKCICGSKKVPHMWYGINEKRGLFHYECAECDHEGPWANTKKLAKIYWNEVNVKEEI